jgi:peptidyl-prolyl cis-trans isomerase A (cyclophilin A)
MTRWRALVAAGLVALATAASSTASAAGPQVAFDTTMGRIVVELDPERAPVTCRNFLAYVAEGHYDGTLVHRVVEGFVIQGGGLAPDMKEKPTHPAIVNEARSPAGGGLSNQPGTIAMAREAAVDSATAQWFINVADNSRLDHVDVPEGGATVTRRGSERFVPRSEADSVFGYAVFGHVVDGMDVVERMRHVAVHTVEAGETYENVPIEPIVIKKAVLLPSTH